MKAAFFSEYKGKITIEQLPEPELPKDGVLVKVKATGICRSDWHGWMGHDSDVRLPHVPGHEFAGEVVAVGPLVKNWRPGDRVTTPFCLGCGACPTCRSGNQQICDNYYQPGFTGWGSFAEYVALPFADHNLVRLPEALQYWEAALLGCRFITAFRAIVDQGRLQPGEWIAVHGCGGVGLSAIMIASSMGALPIAVDIRKDALDAALRLGAVAAIDASINNKVVETIFDITGGGAQVSMDALGSVTTCLNSINCLRKRGKHLQVGLMTGDAGAVQVPLARLIAHELEIIGSHGMQAHRYPMVLELLEKGRLPIAQLLDRRVDLPTGVDVLGRMGSFPATGAVVIEV